MREFQRHTTQWGMGKNFDRTGGFGPWMVTADEVPQGGKGLEDQNRLNGKTMQSDPTPTTCMFPLAETCWSTSTKGMTLEPGDVILTGTPSGVGHARKPEPVWMKAGDTCEIEIEGIGVLRNPIEDEKYLRSAPGGGAWVIREDVLERAILVAAFAAFASAAWAEWPNDKPIQVSWLVLAPAAAPTS